MIIHNSVYKTLFVGRRRSWTKRSM